MREYVPLPSSGRQYSTSSRVYLGDVDPAGRLRLDGVARILQDVATDDWDDSGINTEFFWVARRTSFRAVGEQWPRYQDHLVSTTWCAGTGAAWAERRTNIYAENELVIEAASLWVPINESGFPQRIPSYFFDVYGEALQGRKVPGRVETPEVMPGATGRPWILRRSDLDVVGHVNNAAVWRAVQEVVDAPVVTAEMTHHGQLEFGEDVQLRHQGKHLWLVVDEEVRVSVWWR
jgi:acyl-ACP thioesterase